MTAFPNSPQASTPAAQHAAPITASQLFDEKRTSPFVLATVFALCMLLIGAVSWASRMPLAEVAISAGEVVTVDAVHNIQHLEGGIVAHVHVAEGDNVAVGDLLVTFAPEIAETELSRLRTKRAASRARLKLLKDALAGTLQQTIAPASEYHGIVAAEHQALISRRDSFEQQMAVLKQQMFERQAELDAIDVRSISLAEQANLVAEKNQMMRDLAQSNALPRMNLLDSELEFSRLVGEQDSTNAERVRLLERISAAQARIAELRAQFEADLASEISILTTESAELALTIAQAEDRFNRLAVRATVSGHVQDLQVKSDDRVVAPGALLMNIIPAKSALQVEARVSTRDVGHIAVGDPVEIKVQTFDYSRFGTIEGKITQISAATFLDSDGAPYFKAIIRPSTAHIDSHPQLHLSPGMTVEVDIITGQRSLLDYLLTPIQKSLDSAFHER